ncbi:hypothetical protein PsorP6_017969 [Peronosclerospora sorghi]|uniref:Uncharacterized protein n=1 Tax=Peronosclerospora sorghi TaxID=230839 RepID=A0ACC0WEH1_9STRA|nr:hypothetical protein PsorP6_017969 [Peronosclerospora sorghi]
MARKVGKTVSRARFIVKICFLVDFKVTITDLASSHNLSSSNALTLLLSLGSTLLLASAYHCFGIFLSISLTMLSTPPLEFHIWLSSSQTSRRWTKRTGHMTRDEVLHFLSEQENEDDVVVNGRAVVMESSDTEMMMECD